MISLDNLSDKASRVAQENAKYLKKLKNRKPKELDRVVGLIHHEVFQKTDCLTCANCCKTTGPLFIPSDVKRISKRLNMKPTDFQATYLRVDEDGDSVLQHLPCPFLGADNRCSIYDDRPKACREFPHTDRPKFHQITAITEKNVSVCPAVYNILERLKSNLPL